ncbi:NUDIX domain-containing protein [Actinospica robiniae]|uniref:ADP-ribose pyrophosphatase n=1 Tax=Actinospica robiniae DSM 44927 TaxID=479430 RepID=W9E517_9ACTN|nr:NUDIX domain-containing protein [Actinospica robiniae]ETA71121.1 ADP-ribose pyrophosphatase [Actinospica robiniae DSM 44927]
MNLPPYLSPEDEQSAASTTASGAMAIVTTPAGIVLHLRDDKPEIPHPACWSLFGGATDDGELPDQTIRRELREELALDEVNLRPLWRVVDLDGDGRQLTIFEARTHRHARELTLAEGQALGVFDLASALELRLADFCRRSLLSYAAQA